jgi:predicted dienelactone hydrolase
MCRRMHTGAHFALILMLVLLSLAVASAQDQPTPDGVGLRPDAPPYALHGPYWVGTQDFLIGEGTDDELQAHIWYPALNPDGLEEAIAYASVTKDASFPETLDATTYGHALLNAAVDVTNAPYPLVVFSHGFGTRSPYLCPFD